MERHLGGAPNLNLSPAYSPDGKYPAYCSQRELSGRGPVRNGNVLCIVSLETGREREFSQQIRSLGITTIARTRWSPDSRSILFYGYKTTGAYGSIYRLNVQTGEVFSLVQSDSEVRVHYPMWASNGTGIIFSRRDMKTDLISFVHRTLDIGREKTLLSLPVLDNPNFPDISPDGKWLCLMTRGREWERVFWVVDTAGGEPRRIYDLTGQKEVPNRFAWAADGKQILFTRSEAGVGWQLWRLPIDGGKPVLLGLAEHSFVPHLSAHPDGKRIAFSNGPLGGAEIWVMENFLPKEDAEKKQH